MLIFYGEKSVELEKFAYSIAEDIVCIETLSEMYNTLTKSKDDVILILSASLPLNETLNISENIRLNYPNVRVLLSRNRLDVDTLSKALRAGVSEVVTSEDSANFGVSVRHLREVAKKTSRLREQDNSNSDKAKVVVVFSAKGGCGKTTVSINLATALSELKSTKVLLIDLDLQFGDIGVSLQQDLEKTISAAISMGAGIDLLGASSILTHYDSNLDLLLAPSNPTDVEFISGELVESLINALSRSYDYIVIDTPPAFTDFVLKSMELMDAYFLITTLDMPAIKNLKIVLQTLDALKVNKSQMSLIINKSDSKTGISIEEAENLLGYKAQYKLPNDGNVSIATNQGISTIRFAPKSPLAKQIRLMASDLELRFGTAKIQEKPRRKSFFLRNRRR